MDGVSRSLYRRVKPYLCALPGTDPAAININMVSPDHAPVLLALLPADSGVNLSDIRAQIGALPPGGLTTLDTLEPPLSTVPGIAVVSAQIEALIRLEVNGRTIEEKLLFEATQGAAPKLLARTFGDDY
jgi:general secretion pathway protein K